MAGKAKTYTNKELAGYLVGMFGQNVIYNIIATGLYFYFQNVICLPAMALGWIFTIARIWDAINDPMMGTIVDKTRTKWGKCRPYLIIFPAIIGVVTILTFINGNYAEAESSTQKVFIIAWAAVSYIAWGMVYTVCDIPLWGITSLMTEDEGDRSKILGLARIAAGLAGVSVLIVQIAQLVAGIFAANGMEQSKASQYGFIVTAAVMTIISSIMFEFAGISTRERVEQSERHYTIAQNFKIMFKNKPFRQILISGVLRSPIQLLMIIAITLITYYYANGDFMNILLKDDAGNVTGLDFDILIKLLIIAAGVFVGQFAAMGLTPVLVKKIEKKTLYNFFSLVGAIPFAAIFVIYKLANGDIRSMFWVIISGILFLFAGAAMGGINVLQSVMIADCVDYEEYTNGVRTDGVFFSGQSFITKLSAGIATIISAVVYDMVGYSGVNIDTMNKALANGASFVEYNDGKFAAAMFFLISIPPAIGMILSAIPTLKYALTDKEHAKILDILITKRAEKEALEAATAQADAPQAEAQDVEVSVDETQSAE